MVLRHGPKGTHAGQQFVYQLRFSVHHDDTGYDRYDGTA